MPTKVSSSPSTTPLRRRKKSLPGITREDSDDELGSDDLPWEWIHEGQASERNADTPGERKRRKVAGNKIIGARLGNFECRIGDTVMLKADGSNEAWVAIICDFIDDDGEGNKAANFMWFSSEKEIRSKERKRSDFYWVSAIPSDRRWSAFHWLFSLTLRPERTLHFSVMGRESPCFNQRQSKGHVPRCLSFEIPFRQSSKAGSGSWQDIRLSSSLQHTHCNVHGRIRLGRTLRRRRGYLQSH